jgi:excinuclease UvrABC nuclease subunit
MHLRINHKDFKIKDSIPVAPGVYSIIALDENECPIEINRFLDTDQSGTLYIGKSDNLRKRLTNMRRAFSLNHKSRKHIAVRRFYHFKKVADKFPIDTIVISFKLARDGLSAKQLETQKLNLYERIFGERPPLNKQ